MSRQFARHYSSSDFYCMNCGCKGLPIQRNLGQQRERMHRKKLYCFHCKAEVNHVECRSYDEVIEFKENYEKGAYIDEAKASLDYVRDTRIG